jgi:outer membrane protein assembly factor BamB
MFLRILKLGSVFCLILYVGIAVANLEQQLAEIFLGLPQVRAGLYVQVNCKNGRLLAELVRGKGNLAHGLALEQAVVNEAREYLREQKLYGQATIEKLTSTYLPYADNLVNLIIVSNTTEVLAAGISFQEILRVVCPEGVVILEGSFSEQQIEAALDGIRIEGHSFISGAGVWTKVIKSRPEGMAEWTHAGYDASNTAVSPDETLGPLSGLQWLAGPHTSFASKQGTIAAVTSKGRIFYVTRNDASSVTMSKEATRECLFLVARDAYNGLRLWSKPYSLGRVFRVPDVYNNSRMVASGERLYLILDNGDVVALEADTGNLVRTYEQRTSPAKIMVHNDRLIVVDNGLRVYDLETGAIKWQKALGIRDAVVGAGRIFALTHGGTLYFFNFETGREESPSVSVSGGNFFFYRAGVLVFARGAQSGSFDVYSSEDGAKLWDKTGIRDWPLRKGIYFADGLIWYYSGGYSIGCNPRSGVVERRIRSGLSHTCSRGLHLERYIIYHRPLHFIDRRTGELHEFPGNRGACIVDCVPANGLLYTMPTKCHCVDGLRGFLALSSFTRRNTLETPRLQKGSITIDNFPEDTPHKDGDWPGFRQDSHRSCYLKTKVSPFFQFLWEEQLSNSIFSKTLQSDWKSSPLGGDILTQPVIANGLVFVSLVYEHRIVALDIETREEKWSYTAGGLLDTPPTIYKGLCLFGSADGYVYCLLAETGQLVWKYRVAPFDIRIIAYGQIESKWPVVGGVVVENDVAYAIAGRSEPTDSGIYLQAINILTGDMLAEKRYNSGDRVCGMLVSNGLRVGPVNVRESDWMSLIGATGSTRLNYLRSLGCINRVLDREWEMPAAKERYRNRTHRQLREFLIRYGLLDKFSQAEGQIVTGCPNGEQAFAYQAIIPRPSNDPGWNGGYYSECKQGQLVGWKESGESWRIDLPEKYQIESMAFTDEVLFISGVCDMYQPEGKGFLWSVSTETGGVMDKVELTVAPVSDGLAIAGGKVFISTRDGKIICFKTTGTVIEAPKKEIIKSELYQSYPSISLTGCHIPYSVGGSKGASSEVIIRIYNILGKKIRELNLGLKPSGRYLSINRAAYWDGRDALGVKVSSGMYLCELVLDGKTVGVKKSLTLK